MRRMQMLKLLVASSALAAASSQAQAATYIFTVTGASSATWQLDSNPVPSSFVARNFIINNVSGTFGGNAGLASLTFFTNASGGGLSLAAGAFAIDTFGSQLFSGPTSAPNFLTGTFTLPDANGGSDFTLTIANAASVIAVPEPATWALMLGGFAFVGGMLRTRKQAVRVRYS